jgi:hypothetical protein
MDDYEVEWALKKEEEADLLKDIQIFQQETLNEVQRTRLAGLYFSSLLFSFYLPLTCNSPLFGPELHERQDAEMKYAQLPKVQLMIEHVRARLAALKDQKEQITHLRRSNHESRLELLLANSSEELKKFELHSKELHPNGGIETPRRKKIRQDLKNQYEKRLKHLNEIAQVEGEASSQLSTDPELETELERLLQEEQRLIAAAPTVEDDLTPLMNSARQDPTSARSRSPARTTSSRGTSAASARGSPQPAAPSSHRSASTETDSHEPQAPRGRRPSYTQNDLPPVELPTIPKKSAGANSNRLEPVTSFIRRRGTSFGSAASSPGQIPTPASTNGVTASPSDPSPNSGRARGRTVHTDKNLSQSAPLTPPPSLSSIPAPTTPPTLVSSSSSSALKSILLKPLSKRESAEKKAKEVSLLLSLLPLPFSFFSSFT